MSIVNFDTKKTLEELEAGDTKRLGRAANISRGHVFRQKPVKDLTTEELRLMMMQNTSLLYLVPLAIDRLHLDSLLKGDGYEGDLLNTVLTIEKKFWKDDLNGYIPALNAIVEKAEAIVKANPSNYEIFSHHSAGAIKIFKNNIAHL